MVESRWLRWIGPGVVALGAVALIGSATVGAGTRTWAPRTCAGPPTDRMAAARASMPATPSDLAAAPWFRLDPVAADDGSLGGERLVVGRFGEALTQTRDLPAESFAAGPFGRIVLTGADDGSASRLELVDVAGRCSWLVATERDVIRRATIDPAGATIYEMRVDRATRADLGIWRRRLDATLPAEQILDPISPDARFGITFSTELTWDLAGERLAVQSCGEFACRTRVVDPRGGPARELEAPDLGLLVGVDGERVVTYADCHGLPCPIVSTDVATGTRTIARRCRRSRDPCPHARRSAARPRDTDADGARPAFRRARRRRHTGHRPHGRRDRADRDAALGRIRDATTARLGASGTRWPPPGRPDRPPPTAPPHPGRCDRPAR